MLNHLCTLTNSPTFNYKVCRPTPEYDRDEIMTMIHNIDVAARVALGDIDRKDAKLREADPLDARKFDMPKD